MRDQLLLFGGMYEVRSALTLQAYESRRVIVLKMLLNLLRWLEIIITSCNGYQLMYMTLLLEDKTVSKSNCMSYSFKTINLDSKLFQVCVQDVLLIVQLPFVNEAKYCMLKRKCKL